MNIPNLTKKQILNSLRNNQRLDKRELMDYRDIVIESGVSINAEGSSRVKLGNTEIIVGVKMSTQAPYTDHEDEGTLITSMEFSPISGSRYESGPPGMNSIEVARIVDRGIRESGFIDWKKLCIIEGEKVWSISVDIYCINDDGNVLDASSIGTIAALKFAKFPVYDKEKDKIEYGQLTNESLPLTDCVPFNMTFHKLGDKLIIDPNREEEDTSVGRLTLAISCPKKEKIINAMQKGNLESITSEEIQEIIINAEKIYDKIFPEIEKKIKLAMKK